MPKVLDRPPVSTPTESKAPVPRTAAAPAVSSDLMRQVSAVATSRRELEALADSIIRTKCHAVPGNEWVGHVHRHFSVDEKKILEALNWDPQRIATECGRWRGIFIEQMRAGSVEDRQRDTDRLCACQEALDRRGQEIRVEVERLTNELRQLEHEHKTACDVCEARTNALKQLRHFVPSEIKAAHEDAMREQIGPLDSEISRLRIEIENANNLTKIDAGSLTGKADVERVAAARGLPSFMDDGKSINTVRWQRFVGEQRGRLPALEASLRAAKTRRAAAVREVDGLLDIFAR